MSSKKLISNKNHNNKKIKIDNITLIEISGIEEMFELFDLINQSHRHLTFDQYRKMITEIIAIGNYKMLVAKINDNNITRNIAVAGFMKMMMLYCGRYLQICNFVVDTDYRGIGIGEKMLKYLENKALELDCNKIVLDSYIENRRSHNLYYQQGYYIRGFHFMKDLIEFKMTDNR